MPKIFDQDAKDRIVRLIEEKIRVDGVSLREACRTVAPTFGASRHTARQWVQEARHARRTVPDDDDVLAENARLRRENRELRDTNELLKAAAAYFHECKRPATADMVAFIDKNRARFTVEFMCGTLNRDRSGGFLTSRGYRDAKTRRPSARQIRDRQLVELVRQIQKTNRDIVDVGKMWHALLGRGIAIGREKTRQIMERAGIAGK